MPTAAVVKQDREAKICEEDIKKLITEDDSLGPQNELTGGVIFLDSLPRNNNGKIVRRRLAQIYDELQKK